MYKPPQQQRSRESLERILDAAESLIRERGFEAMTIAEVVERSGSSVGSLYARFRNKRGLLQAVQGRYVDRVETALAAAMAGSTDDRLEDCVNRVVGHLCDYLLNDPKLFRAFILEAVFDARIRGQGEKISGARRDMVTEALLQHRAEIGHPDPVLAARWFYTLCLAVLRERITFGEGAELSGAFDDATMKQELCRTARAYLSGDTVHI